MHLSLIYTFVKLPPSEHRLDVIPEILTVRHSTVFFVSLLIFHCSSLFLYYHQPPCFINPLPLSYTLPSFTLSFNLFSLIYSFLATSFASSLFPLLPTLSSSYLFPFSSLFLSVSHSFSHFLLLPPIYYHFHSLSISFFLIVSPLCLPYSPFIHLTLSAPFLPSLSSCLFLLPLCLSSSLCVFESGPRSIVFFLSLLLPHSSSHTGLELLGSYKKIALRFCKVIIYLCNIFGQMQKTRNQLVGNFSRYCH